MAAVPLAADRYLRGEILGRGSTATVYRAHDQLLDRPVALKEIHLNNAGSVLLAEARAAAGISHPNVVTIHDVIVDDNGSYIAMELLDGPTLGDVLRSGFPLPDEAMRIACDLASALDAAHRRGIVHCDIKPDNIFVTTSGRIVVTDFGLAAPELGGGTPGYMAPEQYTDEPPDPSMDVFAWACVVVELLCGAPPFGTDPNQAEQQTVAGAASVAVEPFGHWRGLWELVGRCLDPIPERRPHDGSALFAELSAVLWQSPPATVPVARDVLTPPLSSSEVSHDIPQASAPAPVDTAAAIRLVVVPPAGDAWYFDLLAGEEIDVGREARLLIDDSQVSRHHVSLHNDGAQLVVTDLGSMNGTYVNGHLVDRAAALPGDVIYVGTTSIVLEEVAYP